MRSGAGADVARCLLRHVRLGRCAPLCLLPPTLVTTCELEKAACMSYLCCGRQGGSFDSQPLGATPTRKDAGSNPMAVNLWRLSASALAGGTRLAHNRLTYFLSARRVSCPRGRGFEPHGLQPVAGQRFAPR